MPILRPVSRLAGAAIALALVVPSALPARAEAPAAVLQLTAIAPADTQLYVTASPTLASAAQLKAFGMTTEASQSVALMPGYLKQRFGFDTASLMQGVESSTGFSFERDLAPWLGSECALAVGGVTVEKVPVASFSEMVDDEPQDTETQAEPAKPNTESHFSASSVLMAATVADLARAGEVLHRLSQASGERPAWKETSVQGVPVYVSPPSTDSMQPVIALLPQAVIMGNRPETVEAAIARAVSRGPSLAADPDFQAQLDRRGDRTVGFAYATESLLERVAFGVRPGADEQDLAKALKLIHSFAGTALLSADSLEFDVTAHMDRAGFVSRFGPPSKPIQLDPRRVDPRAWLVGVFNVSPIQLDRSLDKKTRAQLHQALKQLETLFGLSLERDVLGWLQGPMTVVVLPNDSKHSPLPISAYLTLETPRLAQARQGIDKLSNLASMAFGATFSSERTGALKWRTLRADKHEPAMAGYAFDSKTLYMALGGGMNVLAHPAPKPTLPAALSRALSKLPARYTSMIWVDVSKLVGLAKDRITKGNAKANGVVEEPMARIDSLAFASDGQIDPAGFASLKLVAPLR